jgi:hypothetical protein
MLGASGTLAHDACLDAACTGRCTHAQRAAARAPAGVQLWCKHARLELCGAVQRPLVVGSALGDDLRRGGSARHTAAWRRQCSVCCVGVGLAFMRSSRVCCLQPRAPRLSRRALRPATPCLLTHLHHKLHKDGVLAVWAGTQRLGLPVVRWRCAAGVNSDNRPVSRRCLAPADTHAMRRAHTTHRARPSNTTRHSTAHTHAHTHTHTHTHTRTHTHTHEHTHTHTHTRTHTGLAAHLPNTAYTPLPGHTKSLGSSTPCVSTSATLRSLPHRHSWKRLVWRAAR